MMDTYEDNDKGINYENDAFYQLFLSSSIRDEAKEQRQQHSELK